MSIATDYQLQKWSRMVRIRDGFICQLCKESGISRRILHAHHIDRKVDDPDKALHLDNGICLCGDCHLRIVHSTHDNHKMFRVIFKRWVRRKKVKQFNEQYQERIG